MTAKLWAFRDATGVVRVTPTDPSIVLADLGLQKSTAEAPGGFSMRDLRRYFETTESTLAGGSGRETFVEFTLGDLSTGALGDLMTPPPDPTDEIN